MKDGAQEQPSGRDAYGGGGRGVCEDTELLCPLQACQPPGTSMLFQTQKLSESHARVFTELNLPQLPPAPHLALPSQSWWVGLKFPALLGLPETSSI